MSFPIWTLSTLKPPGGAGLAGEHVRGVLPIVVRALLRGCWAVVGRRSDCSHSVSPLGASEQLESPDRWRTARGATTLRESRASRRPVGARWRLGSRGALKLSGVYGASYRCCSRV